MTTDIVIGASLKRKITVADGNGGFFEKMTSCGTQSKYLRCEILGNTNQNAEVM